jgi:hypothetical protein
MTQGKGRQAPQPCTTFTEFQFMLGISVEVKLLKLLWTSLRTVQQDNTNMVQSPTLVSETTTTQPFAQQAESDGSPC